MKNRSIQKDLENKNKEDDIREIGFVEGLE